MGIGELFWLFVLFGALQPVIRQRMLDAARQRMIARLEAERGSRVILLVHRQETMSLLGFPLVRYIDIQDSEEVLRAIHMTDPDVPLDLVLHTPGGLVLASLQIARALKAHPAKVTVFVPHYAMSGGTLIALAADEIVMSPHAVLGPLDPQLGQYPAPSLLRVVQQKPLSEIDDHTLVLADLAEKATRQLQEAIVELLGEHMSAEHAHEVARRLTEGHWTHDYPITPKAARELGLPVSTDLPPLVYQLMALYPQPVRQRPSVEYLPEPRTSRA
ncbi:MAG: ATP-dependent Clp protease proteolytic subunit [Bacteroidetes bacterium]|nr:ATP-dependent Clp protease proteolytic subunit [Rhodothermia bacterium]MCS7154978.1 ATP-dependent Clp protease proteolytic subunit [Bacteroidota bacterium]MCX7907262.1 ATP-dependent Clp protease proteolytic subunit [Bacteroidota bacterium]MDW8138012.1 ATP-dependent Clp protease proteolytic subunit [Bacteroidota bacterium]MDW8286136.1 ATP-dependent Clp protease proteolytic subunit [Bacteroidota bacterium]